MQEPFLRGIHDRERLVGNVRLLVQAAALLNVPILTTVQYAERMGGFVSEIAQAFPDAAACVPVDKMCFSCAGSPAFLDGFSLRGTSVRFCCAASKHTSASRKRPWIWYHRGYQVHVAADAVSSRRLEKHKLGMERMRDSAASSLRRGSRRIRTAARSRNARVQGHPQAREVASLLLSSPIPVPIIMAELLFRYLLSYSRSEDWPCRH